MNFSRKFFTVLMLFLIWLLLTGKATLDEVLTGIFVAIIISLFTGSLVSKRGMFHFLPEQLWGKVKFIFVFMIELVKANVDVAKRVLSPKIPLNPGIVRVKTKLVYPNDKLWLANSITLTPGTMTLDVKDDELFIHWIDVKTTDPDEAGEIIKGAFERHLGGGQ